ncbi:hypothetical protein M1I95_17570 [Rossellomorea marisflavi]|uniref:hypothetical protein n=1 Tax=Rossellomorea marisflavi TaxID=189381 RepID=UPI0027A4B466|nr:hypothetical protein [Rossellomorea marisflavi]UTE72051.1 hypothetical protein M1I95_17570 [Rossellomorea marisflavi]
MKSWYVLFILLGFIHPHTIAGKSMPEQVLLEDMQEDGYIGIEDAVAAFEDQQQMEVKLPRPPFHATIALGKASPDTLTLQWFDTVNHAHIRVTIGSRPSLNKSHAVVVTLKDGVKVFYRVDPPHHTLSFISGGLTYDIYTSEPVLANQREMVEFANSFN